MQTEYLHCSMAGSYWIPCTRIFNKYRDYSVNAPNLIKIEYIDPIYDTLETEFVEPDMIRYV